VNRQPTAKHRAGRALRGRALRGRLTAQRYAGRSLKMAAHPLLFAPQAWAAMMGPVVAPG